MRSPTLRDSQSPKLFDSAERSHVSSLLGLKGMEGVTTRGSNLEVGCEPVDPGGLLCADLRAGYLRHGGSGSHDHDWGLMRLSTSRTTAGARRLPSELAGVSLRQGAPIPP